MTRINLVPVDTLSDSHLFSEWREMKMVPAALRRSLRTRKQSVIFKEISQNFTLNTGHVKFFFDKMDFLSKRYKLLTDELLIRKYNISSSGNFDEFLFDIPKESLVKKWIPTNDEVSVSVERILLRLNERPTWYRYYGEVVDPAFFAFLYKN